MWFWFYFQTNADYWPLFFTKIQNIPIVLPKCRILSAFSPLWKNVEFWGVNRWRPGGAYTRYIPPQPIQSGTGNKKCETNLIKLKLQSCNANIHRDTSHTQIKLWNSNSMKQGESYSPRAKHTINTITKDRNLSAVAMMYVPVVDYEIIPLCIYMRPMYPVPFMPSAPLPCYAIKCGPSAVARLCTSTDHRGIGLSH